jgi:hypothetical protein
MGIIPLHKAAMSIADFVFACQAHSLEFHPRTKLQEFSLYLNENYEGTRRIPPRVGNFYAPEGIRRQQADSTKMETGAS